MDSSLYTMHAIHKESGIKNKKSLGKPLGKMGAPRFTVSDELTALQDKMPLPDKYEEAKAFIRGIRTK